MTRQRKTMDVWEFWIDYGQGPELECTELGYYQMCINRKAYRENGYSPDIRKKRKPLSFCDDHAWNARAEAKARKKWYRTKKWRCGCGIVRPGTQVICLHCKCAKNSYGNPRRYGKPVVSPLLK